MTTTQDEFPYPARRSPLCSDGVRAAARLVMHTATAVVVVALGVAATAGWRTPVALGGWTVAAAAGAVGLLTGVLRALLGSDPPADRGHGRLFVVLLVSILVWTFMATFAFCLSYFFHAHALDRHASVKVRATVSHCVNRGDAGSVCTYRWLADHHTYSSRDTADRVWPDGHRVTVRIDPAHPDRPAQVTRAYWAAWIGVAVGALGTPFGVVSLWAVEPGVDRM